MPEIAPNEVLRQLMVSSRATSSWIAAMAARVPLVAGTVHTNEGDTCAACGHRFLAGERAHTNATHKSKNFNDAYSMRGPSTAPICSACAVVFSAAFLPLYPTGVACSDGFFPFASNAHRAWFLLNPPEGPFVMATRLAKQQHLFWRTPVGLNREIYPIRVGTHVGVIRRKLLQRVAAMSSEILEATAAYEASQARAASARGRPRTPGASAPAHPYGRLDREMASSRHGDLKASVVRYLASGKAPREANVLTELNAIELWALSNIANTKPKDVLTERPPVYQPSVKSADEQPEG